MVMTENEALEAIEKRLACLTGPNEECLKHAFCCDECPYFVGKEEMISALKTAIPILHTQLEAKSPCAACRYGGKHLDAPPCTSCPAYPKEPEKNEPLTLEELRKMDGKPVYVVWDGHGEHWALVHGFWKSEGVAYLTYSNGASDLIEILLNEGAKIYRHPPKEAKK